MRNILEKIAKWWNKKPSIKDVVDEVNEKLSEGKVKEANNKRFKILRRRGVTNNKDKKGAFGKHPSCLCKKRNRG